MPRIIGKRSRPIPPTGLAAPRSQSPFPDLGRYGTIVLLVEQKCPRRLKPANYGHVLETGWPAPGGKLHELSSNEGSLCGNLGCARGARLPRCRETNAR
jgi:hypothetical protein